MISSDLDSAPILARSRFFPEFGRPETKRWIRGDCYQFALALHEILDRLGSLPQASFVGLGGTPEFPGHVALLMDGCYHDIRGFLIESDFRSNLQDADGPIFPLTLDQVALHAGYAGCRPPFQGKEMAAARKIAKAYFAWFLPRTARRRSDSA